MREGSDATLYLAALSSVAKDDRAASPCRHAV